MVKQPWHWYLILNRDTQRIPSYVKHLSLEMDIFVQDFLTCEVLMTAKRYIKVLIVILQLQGLF